MNTEAIVDKVLQLLDKAGTAAMNGGTHAYEQLVQLKVVEGVQHLIYAGFNTMMVVLTITVMVKCFNIYCSLNPETADNERATRSKRENCMFTGVIAAMGMTTFGFFAAGQYGLAARYLLAPEALVIKDLLRAL